MSFCSSSNPKSRLKPCLMYIGRFVYSYMAVNPSNSYPYRCVSKCFRLRTGVCPPPRTHRTSNRLWAVWTIVQKETRYERAVTSGTSELDVLIGLPTSQAGITHGFVVEFESAEDRDYYVFKDPTHIAFTKIAGEVLANAIVVDFNPGSFGAAKI
jgi:hypothetical protein